MSIANIRKFIVALVFAGGIAVTGLADGDLTLSEGIAIGLGFLSSLGVYTVRNDALRP